MRYRKKLFLAVLVFLSLPFIIPVARAVQQTVDVILFYSKDGYENPDGSKDVPVPNWYYFWKQTSANCSNSHEYGGESCFYFGYYRTSDEIFHICDSASGDDTRRGTNGIDTFAITCLHENEHLKHWLDWYGSFKYVECTHLSDDVPCPDDVDKDGVPDEVELSSTVAILDPNNPKTYACCDITELNVVDCKTKKTDCIWSDDEEYLAYEKEKEWQIGKADKEDWACPGKQCDQ